MQQPVSKHSNISSVKHNRILLLLLCQCYLMRDSHGSAGCVKNGPTDGLIGVFRSPYLDLDAWYCSLKTCRVVGKDLGHAFALIVVKESLCCVCPPPVFSSQVHSWPGCASPLPMQMSLMVKRDAICCKSLWWSSSCTPSTPIWRKHTSGTWLINALNTRFTIDSKCSQH